MSQLLMHEMNIDICIDMYILQYKGMESILMMELN